MKFTTPQVEGWLIGDPHFGKDFKGTPIHRRGERERMQMEQFREELRTPDVNMVVMVGDLFDKPFVPLTVINDVVQAVVEAAQERENVWFVFLAGNHDKSRQIGLRGAWELFSVAVGWLPNVEVINEPSQILDVAFFPWEWVGTAEAQLEYFYPKAEVAAAVGHWDTIDFGNTDHMVPVRRLLELNPNIDIYTGHDHRVGLINVGGYNVHRTGSMQPYAHGEDDGEMYVTLTTAEALERDDLSDKCVRIILEPGEALPDIDCLQLTSMRGETDASDVEVNVSLGDFDVERTLEEKFEDHEVPDHIRIRTKERLGVAS